MPTPARILRGGGLLPARRIDAEVYEADRRVQEMVAAAEAEARRLVAEARAESARIQAEAAARGEADGRARAAAALARGAAGRDGLLRDAEREVVQIALAVARKLLGRELSTSAAAVVQMARAALAEARERREVVLRVSPADGAAVRAAEGTLAATLVRAPLVIREDPAVPPGGAVVETERGRVDASVETQLAAVARAVEEALP
jgi:flagellar biosynthesis/type III secretory pathway protein FliH